MSGLLKHRKGFRGGFSRICSRPAGVAAVFWSLATLVRFFRIPSSEGVFSELLFRDLMLRIYGTKKELPRGHGSPGDNLSGRGRGYFASAPYQDSACSLNWIMDGSWL